MAHSNPITIGMLAHVDAGKTTLSEAILYSAGSIRKLEELIIRIHFLTQWIWKEQEE